MRPFSAPWGESSLRGVSLQAVTSVGCAAGFYLFGYDQGIANALTQNADFFIKFPKLKTNSNVLGAVLGMFVLGAFLGCMTVSALGNKYGRRPILNIASFGTLLGAALQAGSVNLGMFIAARLINGFFVGVLTCVVPVLMAELSKPKIRGLMMSLELVFAASGLMTSFWITYGFSKNQGPIGWRIPLALQAIFVLVTCVCLQFTPESPRWLMEAGRVEEGRQVLTRLHGAEYADKATLEIQEAIALEHATAIKGWSVCFAKNDQMFRYRTFLAMGTNFLQQATGINTATYYAGQIFIQSIGMAPDKASFALGGLGIAGLFATALGCFVLIERAGRVRTMMGGSFLQCVGMIMLAAGVANSDKKAGGYVAATGLYLYLCAFSGSWLPCGFLYGAEISPLAIRTQASCLGIAVQYIMNFAVVEVTPTAIGSIGWKYYIVYAITNAVTIPIVYFFFPEIAGLSLEGIDELFAGGKLRMRRSVHDDVGHQALDSVRAKVTGTGGEKDSFTEKSVTEHLDRV